METFNGNNCLSTISGVPRNFVWGGSSLFGGGGGSTNSVKDRGQRERGSGGGSPLVRGSAQFAVQFDFVKLSGLRWLLRMYFPRNWEFGSALSKPRNFGGGFEPPNPSSVRHCLPWSILTLTSSTLNPHFWSLSLYYTVSRLPLC
jgi:hypothetical protein